jgi:hypothetical protein
MVRWTARCADTVSLPGGASSGPTVWDVDLDGVPEVMVAYPRRGKDAMLFVINGPTGAVEWTWTAPGLYLSSDGYTPAIADLDLDGHPEIVMVNQGRAGGLDTCRVYAIDGVTRQVKWTSDLLVWPNESAPDCGLPTVGDADMDGTPEVVISVKNGSQYYLFCLNGEDGSVQWVREGFWRALPSIGNVNSTRMNEVICSPVNSPHNLAALSGRDGSVVWLNPDTDIVYSAGSMPSIADADADGRPEVVTAGDYKPPHEYPKLALFWFDGETGKVERLYVTQKKRCVAYNPSTAQIDEDSAQESVIFSQLAKLITVDGASAALEWTYDPGETETVGYPSLADIDNDGKVEVLAVSGTGSMPLIESHLICLSPRGELEWEMNFLAPYMVGARPTIADVDGDGYLEIILASCVIDYRGTDILATCIDNEPALPAREEKAARPPSMLVLPGRVVLSLLDPCPVDLSLYDMSGRRVKELYKGQLLPGTHEFELRGLEPGVYLAELRYDGRITTKAVVMRR